MEWLLYHKSEAAKLNSLAAKVGIVTFPICSPCSRHVTERMLGKVEADVQCLHASLTEERLTVYHLNVFVFVLVIGCIGLFSDLCASSLRYLSLWNFQKCWHSVFVRTKLWAMHRCAAKESFCT